MRIFQGVVKIESIETVARETKKFLFSVKNYSTLDGSESYKNTPLPFSAGQFISLQFTEKAWRAYSIASAPTEDLIELVIRIVPGGLGSGMIDKAVVGDEYNFKAPFGHFVLSENNDANLIFLGTGTGIAPLRSMILMEDIGLKRPMKLLYGGRDAEDITYLDEMTTWTDDLKIQLGLSRTEDFGGYDKFAQNCRITEFLEQEGCFDTNSEFYICGNGAMVKSVQAILEEKNIHKERIFMERFN